MQEREEQDDCSMRVVPREIEWIVPSRSIGTKYSGTGHFLLLFRAMHIFNKCASHACMIEHIFKYVYGEKPS